jgi:hypothetical protein
MLPAVAAGVIAAFACTDPGGSFSADTIGRLSPVGYAVRKFTGSGGANVSSTNTLAPSTEHATAG